MVELTKQDMRDRFEKRYDKGFDFTVGPGWFPLLADLDDTLRAIDPRYRILQVKEKYGWLRFYAYRPADARGPWADVVGIATCGLSDDDPAKNPNQRRFRAAIEAAEEGSCYICEECGAPGVLCASGGWWMTRCEACGEKEHAAPLEDDGWG